ncbi:MAG: DNA repair protein RadA [Bacteroidia bacterium]|nr:DNA repair protein RadA [Bacteroidia bacterium]
MAKQRTQFVCQSCGATSARWSGKCDSCGSWNTFVEEVIRQNIPGRGARAALPDARVQPVTAIAAADDQRLGTGLTELDRVLGGGIVSGSVMLLGGDPGIGKSTLMMQLGQRSHIGVRILYISGEESLRQIKLRADRLGVQSDDFLVLAETNLDSISAAIDEHKPHLVIVDSIQTVFRPELESAPGSISQVRECTAVLLRQAKSSGIPMFIIGHVTKDGVIAGPRVLEHMVDTVLQFEGDHHHAYRIVRGLKNRFGSTNEIGIFEMRENGLREVSNPSEVFLSERSRGISGACVSTSLEGTRALLIEVQALVTPSNYGMPQRTVAGLDARRVSLLLAVLEKRYGLRVGQYDVFVNIAGGVRIDEPAIDLAVCAAVVSSARDLPIDHATAIVGEVGLGGEVRSVSQLEKRVAEAAKLGFKRIVLPSGNLAESKRKDIEVVEVELLPEAIEILLR